MAGDKASELILTARPLRPQERDLVFPLVSFRHPGVTLKHWSDFLAHLKRAYGGPNHLMTIVDSRGHFHALFAYCVAPALSGGAQLRVVHIASASLVGDATNRAFHTAINDIAREHGCQNILIEVESGVEGLRGCDERAALERAGFIQAPIAYQRQGAASTG